MKNMLLHMLSGAGSLLDISGHSKISESQARSLRLKNDDDSFYTLPTSDYLNHTCDGYNIAQSTWVPEEGRKAIQSWLRACQEERDRFKEYADMGLLKVKTKPAKKHGKKK
jgi:hypothetical protein